MGQLLAQHGIVPALDDEAPDVCVVNTCSVTEMADKKGRQHIRSLVRQYPKACMVVTGCYAQLQGLAIAAIPGVDMVLGSDQKNDIAAYVQQWLSDRQPQLHLHRLSQMREFGPSCERGDRTRYWLKVQDGCDCYCSYCTIPMARGRSRSGTIASLVSQARQVAAEGGKEIVITGVNIGDFGKNTGERFIDLIRQLDQIEGIERYRISSIEPDLLSDEIIEFCARSRAFMPHFHIPLQSGNDEVLRLMRRRYTRSLFAEKISKIRQLIPHCFIGVDVMVGTRGETDERFADSLRFISSLPVQHLHVFPYSERPGTLALRIPHIVPHAERQRRVAAMMRVSDEKQRQFISHYLHTVRPVLLEQPHGDGSVMHGFTDNYIRVTVPASPQLVNRVVPVRLDALNPDLTVTAQPITKN